MSFARGNTASMVGRTGQVGTTAEALDEVSGFKAGLGILIKNIDSTEDLLVGTAKNVPTTSNGFTLQPGEEVFLEIQDTDNIRVIASANTCDYTWVQY